MLPSWLFSFFGHHDPALEPPLHPVVQASGHPPVALDLDIAVKLEPDELLGPLLDALGLHQGSEDSSDAGETAVTAAGSNEEELFCCLSVKAQMVTLLFPNTPSTALLRDF